MSVIPNLFVKNIVDNGDSGVGKSIDIPRCGDVDYHALITLPPPGHF